MKNIYKNKLNYIQLIVERINKKEKVEYFEKEI